MLDRILNINPQDKYKSGIKITAHPYAVNRHDQDRQSAKDSALISPLARLLSKINWKILNVEYPSKDEILFNFLVNDLEFITVINFADMYDDHYQEFNIFYYSIINSSSVQTKLSLKTKKDNIEIINAPDPISTENLEYLFETIKKHTKLKTYHSKDPIILNNFIIGYENKINEELEYILKVIYTFISTRFQSKIKNNHNLKTEGLIPIIMQEVAIIHAE